MSQIIKWSPLEFVKPASQEQAIAIVKHIKDIDLEESKNEYFFFGLHTEPNYTDIVKFLKEQGNMLICSAYPNTEFYFFPKYIKGTYVVYTPPKTPFED